MKRKARSEKSPRKSKKWRTVLILPSSPEKKVLTLHLPAALWFAVCALIIAAPFLAGTGLWSLTRSRQLNIENMALRDRVHEQSIRLEHLNGELAEIREKAAFIQKFLGLKSSEGQEGKIGRGGIEISPDKIHLDASSSEIDPSPLMKACATDEVTGLRGMDLNRLKQKLESIIGTLEERQEKLESMPSISPVDPRESWLSSSFGMRTSPFTGKKHFHPGVDIAGSKGIPILAPAKGKVVFAGKNGSLGLSIEIDHDSSFKSTYGHLLEFSVKKGQRVQRGEIIGKMGNTGRSTGYHLHYEIEKEGKRINPMGFMMDWHDNLMLAGE